MSPRTKRYIGGALAVLVALLALLLPWLLDARKSAGDSLPEEPGQEELEQIFGQAEETQQPDANGGSGDTATVDGPAIRGQVLRPNGEPAPGAQVVAQSTYGGDSFEAFADEGGLFILSDVPDDIYVVEASLQGYGPAATLGARPGDASLRLVLQSGGEIEGIVLHRNEPVPRAVVHMGGPGVFPQRTVTADTAGRFRISGVRAGRYELVVTADGLGSGFGARLSLDDTTGEEPIEMDLSVARAPTTRLDILDLATGEPIPSGIVTVSERPLHVLSLSRVIRNGRADIDFLPRGEYWVRVRAPGYLPYEARLFIVEEDSNLEIRLSQGATIRGTVRDEAGNPMPRVSLTAVVETETGGRWELRRSLFDDFHRLVRPDGSPFWLPSIGFDSRDDGTFILTGLPSGEAVVVAERDGYAPSVSPPLTVVRNQVYEPLDLTLSRARRLRGRVEDAGGGAVAEAHVSALPPNVPTWVMGEGVVTDAFGVFTLENLGPEVVLNVRHPDFAPAELSFEVPDEGLDDVIIRLSGEQLPTFSGRILTTRGAPAVGASVWVMSGESALPACRASVQSDGWFHATQCSATPERLIASYQGHAPLIAEIGGDLEERDWELLPGGEIEVVSQRLPLLAVVEPTFPLPEVHWPRPRFELEHWSRDIAPHVAPGNYLVTCLAEGHGEGTVEVTVLEGRRVEALCPNLNRLVETTVYVIDAQGAPVQNALVLIDGASEPLRAITGADGRITVETEAGIWLRTEAIHEDWGRGALPIYVRYQEQEEEFRIALDESIAGEEATVFLDELRGWGIAAVADGRSVVVDRVLPDTPAAGLGLRRHDRVLWARPVSEHRFSIGVRRDGEIVTFDLAREPG